MKYRIAILTVIMALSTMTASVWGDNVDLKRARHTAATYMSAVTGQKAAETDVQLVYQVPNTLQPGVSACYFFNLNNGGFIIVSGSDCTDPILAFDEYNTLDMDNIPPAMMWWINGKCNIISAVQNSDVRATSEIQQEWSKIDNETLPLMNSKENVILMSEQWSQSGNDDYHPTYNKKCPRDNNGRYCPVGCVATAMSQIMHYWRYPRVGNKTKSAPWPSWDANGNRTEEYITVKFKEAYFDYDMMPNKLYSTSPSAQIDSTAALCLYAGLSVNMSYYVDGSGAHSYDVPTAIKKYFKYDNTAELIYRYDYYGRIITQEDDWCNMVKTELDSLRPVYYSGYDNTSSGGDAGHAFICHGYRPSSQVSYFRFNWGWGGSGDAWYNMRDRHGLNVSEYDFYYEQDAIFGLQPPADSNRFHVGIQSVAAGKTDLMAAHPNPARSSIVLPYMLSGNDNAEMLIMDITGKVVERISVQPGKHDVTLNVSRYTKGIYVYRLNGKARKFMVN